MRAVAGARAATAPAWPCTAGTGQADAAADVLPRRLNDDPDDAAGRDRFGSLRDKLQEVGALAFLAEEQRLHERAELRKRPNRRQSPSFAIATWPTMRAPSTAPSSRSPPLRQ